MERVEEDRREEEEERRGVDGHSLQWRGRGHVHLLHDWNFHRPGVDRCHAQGEERCEHAPSWSGNRKINLWARDENTTNVPGPVEP